MTPAFIYGQHRKSYACRNCEIAGISVHWPPEPKYENCPLCLAHCYSSTREPTLDLETAEAIRKREQAWRWDADQVIPTDVLETWPVIEGR